MAYTVITGITSDVTTLISTVGFPIFMCLSLFYYIQKEGIANREQIAKLSETINNNTIVITKLLERLDKD